MDKQVRVVHVDDHRNWRDLIRDILSSANIEVSSYDSIVAARSAPEPDVYVVDGSVDKRYDGMTQAQELTKQGKKVVVVSGDSPPNSLHSVSKDEFIDDDTAAGKRLIKLILTFISVIVLIVIF